MTLARKQAARSADLYSKSVSLCAAAAVGLALVGGLCGCSECHPIANLILNSHFF